MNTTFPLRNLVNIQEACRWATEFLRREISPTRSIVEKDYFEYGY